MEACKVATRHITITNRCGHLYSDININTRRRLHAIIVRNAFQSKLILSVITYQHFHLSYLMFQIALLEWNQHNQQHHDDQFLLILDVKDRFLSHKGISDNSKISEVEKLFLAQLQHYTNFNVQKETKKFPRMKHKFE